MRCARCGFENPEGAKFCEEGGAPFVRICPSCGQQLRPTAKFCPECGTALRAEGKPTPTRSRSRKGAQTPRRAPRASRPPVTAPSRPASPEAERRQLTVMFCDLVGSTALSEQLDPEELREVVRAYQETSTDVIRRYDGHIAQHLGDGLLAYFSYPVAHEDDSQRAVRAGLGIVEALRDLSQRLNVRLPCPLQVRIGIHTGLVVVGEIGSSEKREILALGETPNIVARVQGLAEPDTVVISGTTYRLSEGFFVCRSLGPSTVKGISAPVDLYHVLEESGVQSRFEAAIRSGLTPLVGRGEELALLLERWEQVKEGQGQVVLLTGEAGIGKSRLLQELKDWVTREGSTRIEFRCSPYYQHTAFYPVIEHLQRLLQFQRDDTPAEKLDKLERMLSRYHLPVQDVVPLFASLLSLPQPDRYPPLTLTPQKQRQKTQEALGTWLLEEAKQRPLLAVWEDLQWADPSTLELHSLFLDRTATARILSVLTCRPEFRPPWGTRAHLTQLTLSRLPHDQVEEIVGKVTAGKALPAEVLQQVVAKTDGVPLFVEELTKMVLESGLVRRTNNHYELTGPLPPLAIPSTLQDSLMARLDRLVTVKELAQLGATLGREFPYEVLRAVWPAEEAALQQGLATLIQAELLHQRGVPPQARYIFKHALIPDTAYQSLLKSKRQQYHQQIAQVLEAQFPEIGETQPELLAHHYTQASLTEQAIAYWQQAGQRAVERSANVEAVRHFAKGLELLNTRPDTPERIQHELALQISLCTPLTMTKGYAAPEVEKAYARARELCQQIGETPQLLPALLGLWRFYLARGELQTAHELGEQVLRLAQSVQDPIFFLIAHSMLGIALFYLGELASARIHLEQGIAIYDPQQHRFMAFLYGDDPGVGCLSFAAWTVGYLGHPDQAVKRIHEALTLAQELAIPHSLAFALNFAAVVHYFRREGRAVQEWAEATMTLATDQGFALWLAQGTIMRGLALAEQGQKEEGVTQMRQGLDAHRATGAEIARPYYLALLAEMYGKVGQAEEGGPLLAEALAVMDKNGERVWEAELYRLKGELTLQSSIQSLESRVKEAERCFRQAIDIARRQSAKSWELRAVMSLARLWQQQGKKDEARQLLAEIYGWFTEGFETKDLQEAKALLNELS